MESVTPSRPPVKVGDTIRIVNDTNEHYHRFTPGELVTVIKIEAPYTIAIRSHSDELVQSLVERDYEVYLHPIAPLTPKGLADTLKDSYPHGHPDFIPDMLKIMELHSAKNWDYASGGDPLGNFDRVADLKRLYPGFPWDSPFGVAWGNMLKQFDAVMWGMAKNIEHKVEGLDARLQDIIVYSAIGRLILRRGK